MTFARRRVILCPHQLQVRDSSSHRADEVIKRRSVLSRFLWSPEMGAVPRRLKRIEVYCPEYKTTATIRINDAHSSGRIISKSITDLRTIVTSRSQSPT